MQVKSGFVASMERYFTNYVGFTGRAPRSDYWWPVLASVLVSFLNRDDHPILGRQFSPLA